MAVSLNGLHGEHVANLVEEEHQSGLVSVIVRLRPLVANNVLARHSNLKTATLTSAQVRFFMVTRNNFSYVSPLLLR